MEVATTPEFAANLNDQAVRCQAEGQYLEADKLYKNSLAIWESVFGPEDPQVAQSLANRAALYRLMGEYHEAERIFQMAQRIWAKRGFPNNHDQPLWADQLQNDGTLRDFGARVRGMRDRLAKGDPASQQEVTETIRRLGPWYHNVIDRKSTRLNSSHTS